jgi:hypothetical protein
MSCATCPFLIHVHNHSDQRGEPLQPCSMKFKCNPFWDGDKHVGRILTSNYCGSCDKDLKECSCPTGVRKVSISRKQVL